MSESAKPVAAPEALFLYGTVQRWREELRALDLRRDTVLQKLEHAERLLDLVREEMPPEPVAAAAPIHVSPQMVIPEIASRPVEVRGDTPWVDMIRQWVGASRDGLTHAELRALVDANETIRQRFVASNKGYYNALSRLANREEIIKHNGRLFSTEAYERRMRAVRAGTATDDVVEPTGVYSPMGEAILDIVHLHRATGIRGKEIIEILRVDPEFNATLTPHTGGAYNIISRLTRRRQLLRRDDGLCFPGEKFPPRNLQSKWIQMGVETV